MEKVIWSILTCALRDSHQAGKTSLNDYELASAYLLAQRKEMP